MRKVIGIGETVLDIIFKNNQPDTAAPGGSTFNSMVSLGRAGVSAYFITEVGNNQPIVPKPETTPHLTKPVVPHRPRFKFSMVGIPIGSELTFIPTGFKVKVASDDQIEYEGRIYKLSPFVGTFMPAEKRNTSGAYQGAKYFTFKGEVLDNLRTRIETQPEQ